MPMTLECTAFNNGQPVPKKFTGEGQDVSPPFSWQGAPQGTQEFALICDDPDAPTPQPWVHWLIYKIPSGTSQLPEGVPATARTGTPIVACQGLNSWPSGRTFGYRGPMPPPGHGTHHYHFKLYALDADLHVNPGIDKAALLHAMSGHILAEAELIGTYER